MAEIDIHGNDKFCNESENVNSIEVAYPQPTRAIDFVFQFVPGDFHDYMHHGNEVEPKMPKTWKISLIDKQVTRNNMVLPHLV